ncbi:MAG TPA: hypothetical protein VG936_18425 [Lacunisphaera sp.]|nr:hypothetical protein [Lacunisphaera sp.]
MKTPAPKHGRPWLRFLIGASLGAGGPAVAAEAVAVMAQTLNDYTRVRLADQSFKPERFVFGEGGCWTRGINDPALDRMEFLDVARTVSGPLRRLNYLPALNAGEAELLILVFWGSTQGSHGYDPNLTLDHAARALAAYNAVKPREPGGAESPEAAAAGAARDSALWELSLANRDRDRLDDRNARILGYGEALDRARFAAHMSFAQDTMAEVADNRYFVVLQAYDFKTVAREKKLKPMWIARVSVSEHGRYDQALAQMVRHAAHYFGQDSHGLHRDVTRDGKVDLGPLEVVGVEPEK